MGRKNNLNKYSEIPYVPRHCGHPVQRVAFAVEFQSVTLSSKVGTG